MRVMKAGVKSSLDVNPKSEFFTSSHVEYLMREQEGDGKAATERYLNWKHKTLHVLENSAASTKVIRIKCPICISEHILTYWSIFYLFCCFGGAFQHCSNEGLLYSSPQWSSVIHLQRRSTPSGVRDFC
jgi:hypothetical protein